MGLRHEETGGRLQLLLSGSTMKTATGIGKAGRFFLLIFHCLLPCHCEQHILTKKRSGTLILPISKRFFLSRFVYTKLLSILGKSLRATEALRVFTIMRVQSFFCTIKIISQLVCTENRKANGLTFFLVHNLHQGDAQIYPDMPAYHSIAVTLGRAGFLKELIKIIEYMRQKPSKRVMTMRRKDWDPSLEPDVLVYNSVRIPSYPFLFFFLPNSLFSVIFFLKYVCLVP